jgi:glutaredoxin-related protein
MKLIGSDICKNCREAKRYLQEKGISYTWVDLTEDTEKMRYFLGLRDTSPVFDGVKAEGKIGIPCFVLSDGTLTLDLKTALIGEGFSPD